VHNAVGLKVAPCLADRVDSAISLAPACSAREAEALHLLRMTGAFYCRTEATRPWALEMPAFADCLSFHVVTAGGCWLGVDGADPLYLRAGDLALVPHGRGHQLFSQPGLTPAGRVDQLPQQLVSEHYSILRHGGGGAPSTLVCGASSPSTTPPPSSSSGSCRR
jgi:hypothetical protein